jgi:hypothetical protein
MYCPHLGLRAETTMPAALWCISAGPFADMGTALAFIDCAVPATGPADRAGVRRHP